MQEFAERWWQVGVGLVVLALVISGVILAGGDEGDGESDAAAEVASAPPEATTPTDETPSAPGTGNGEGQPNDGDGPGEEGGNANGGGSEGTDPATPTPQSPYGPPGDPVGGVPPGAPPSANERAVETTLRHFLVSISKADGPQACAQLSPEGRKRVEDEVHEAAPETQGAPCEGAIVLYQGGYGRAARNPEITEVSVSGTQATAVGPPGKRTAEFSKIDNVWLIDNYEWGN